VAALAYLLLPVTGTIAYFSARSDRTRFHGLQAVVVGVAWPLLLYAASAVDVMATRVVFALGVILWLTLMIGTAVGRDPALPGLGRVLRPGAE
jgi:uncharacterized membrane protein